MQARGATWLNSGVSDRHGGPETGPIERSDLVKGYEVAKGGYILLTDEEIQSVELPGTKSIEIERFVPVGDIDRIYWDHPYYLAPDGKVAEEAFAVIRRAMEKSGRIALGRIVLAARERILALEPRGKGILACTIRSDAEVRKADEIFDSIGNAKPDPDMISIAEKIIGQKAGPFDPGEFVDRYEDALRKLIADKRKGQKAKSVAEPEDTNVIDLMAALRASLAAKERGGSRTGATSASRSRAPRKRASSRSRTRKAGDLIRVLLARSASLSQLLVIVAIYPAARAELCPAPGHWQVFGIPSFEVRGLGSAAPLRRRLLNPERRLP